jgi:hypothetical protein
VEDIFQSPFPSLTLTIIGKKREGNNNNNNKPTPWSRVLPEKLKYPKLLKKFPAFYGTRRFITAFTRARHLSLS